MTCILNKGNPADNHYRVHLLEEMFYPVQRLRSWNSQKCGINRENREKERTFWTDFVVTFKLFNGVLSIGTGVNSMMINVFQYLACVHTDCVLNVRFDLLGFPGIINDRYVYVESFQADLPKGSHTWRYHLCASVTTKKNFPYVCVCVLEVMFVLLW